jgi:hypothetical protein
VHVWLGDLWELPAEEQQYWKAFNVPPAGGLESSFFRSQIGAEFVDTERADHRFMRTRDELNRRWENSFAFPLFRRLPDHESYVADSFHVPTANELREFNEQITYLAKLLVETLNKSALEESVQDKQLLLDEKGNKRPSIQVLEAFVGEKDLGGAKSICRQIKNIQAIRSKLPAHVTSPKDLETALKKAGLNARLPYQQQFELLLRDTTHAMDELLVAFGGPA